jgi:TMEM175 potassium channel family protein
MAPHPGSGASTAAPRGLAKNRIEALADGIFGVAMTLLVLDIKSPDAPPFETNLALAEHLARLVHSFAMYTISFVVLAMFWYIHHLQFHFVRHVDRRLLWLNLIFLLFVTLVPFSTDLLGDHGHLQLPVLIYAANLLVLSTLLLIHVHHLALHRDLASVDFTDRAFFHMRRKFAVFAIVPVLSIVASFWSPRFSIYVYVMLAVPAFIPGRIDLMTHAAGDPESHQTEHP